MRTGPGRLDPDVQTIISVPDVVHVRPRLSRWLHTPPPALAALGAFLTYLIGSVILWGLPLLGHFDTRYAAMERDIGDPDYFRWALAWTPWALSHGQSPLFTDRVFAPHGADLTWSALVPGPAILAWPVTRAFGTLASYNLLMLLSPALAAWGAYLLCRRITHSFWPSLVGGYLFGFSTYMTGQMQRNLNLVLIFPVPIVVYLVIRRAEGSLGPRTFVALTAISLLGLFSISTELLATTLFFGAIAFALAMVVAGADRSRVGGTALLTTAAFLIVGTIVFVPYVLPAIRNASPEPIQPPDVASADLLGFIVPRDQTLVGGERFAAVSDRFTAVVAEDGSYLGLAGVMVLVGFGITERRRKMTRALLAFVGTVAVLSLGPVLHVDGRATFAMPGALLAHLPLIRNAVPERVNAYTALAVAAIAAIWLARAHGRWAWIRWALVGSTAVMMLPSVRTPPWHFSDRTPAFFSEGTYVTVLRPDENVAIISGSRGESLEWQAESRFSFRMPAGYLGNVAFFGGKDPLEALHGGLFVENPWGHGGPHGFPSSREFSGWIMRHDVTAVVVGDLARSLLEPLVRSVGLEPVYLGQGVSVWRFPTAGAGLVSVADSAEPPGGRRKLLVGVENLPPVSHQTQGRTIAAEAA